MSEFVQTTSHSTSAEGIEHGPYLPLGDEGIDDLRTYLGSRITKKADQLSDLAIQSIYQIRMHDEATTNAHREGRVTAEDATKLYEQNSVAEYMIIVGIRPYLFTIHNLDVPNRV